MNLRLAFALAFLLVCPALPAWAGDLETLGADELVARVGKQDVAAAEALVKRFPEQALEPLCALLEGEGSKARWIELIGQVPGAASEAKLKDLLEQIDHRIPAARALRARKRPEGTQSLVAEWTETELSKRKGRGRADRLREIASFLSSEAAGVAALAADLSDRPDWARELVVQVYTSSDWRERGGPSGELQLAIEDLLAERLSDRAEVRGGRPGRTLGDLAAEGLQTLWPKRFRFVRDAPREERAHWRAVCANTIRTARGEELLAVPELPKARKPPARLVKQIQAAFKDARNAQERGQVLSQVQGMGLRGLALLKTVKNPPAEAKALMQDMGYLIDVIRTAKPPGTELPDAFKEALAEQQGRRLSADLVDELLATLEKHRPPGLQGLEVQLYRGGARGGVTLRVVLSARGKTRSVWWCGRGAGTTGQCSAASVVEFLESSKDTELGKALSYDVFDLPPEEPFELHFSKGVAGLSFGR